MIRSFLIAASASLFLVACSTSGPASQSASRQIDPVTDPSIVGAVDEAALQGSIEGEAAARTALRIGRVAGVLAAVLGGPESESVDDAIDRYRDTRDAVETAGAVIGATKGAVAGAKRGYQLDLQFAELHQIEGVEVLRPFPDQIDVSIASSPTPQTLAAIAAVFAGREERFLEIEAAGNAALDIRDALLDLGITAAALNTHRNDDLNGAVIHIRYRD